MTEGAMFWLIVLAVSALIFFGIAVVVSVRGIGDLRDLLSHSRCRRANE
ncbi:MAG TPA: hypothetical protein VLT13_16630 [Bacteroidota bacterium]|nr:hypothetical protein [Bacteroidota bacterium]